MARVSSYKNNNEKLPLKSSNALECRMINNSSQTFAPPDRQPREVGCGREGTLTFSVNHPSPPQYRPVPRSR